MFRRGAQDGWLFAQLWFLVITQFIMFLPTLVEVGAVPIPPKATKQPLHRHKPHVRAHAFAHIDAKTRGRPPPTLAACYMADLEHVQVFDVFVGSSQAPLGPLAHTVHLLLCLKELLRPVTPPW